MIYFYFVAYIVINKDKEIVERGDAMIKIRVDSFMTLHDDARAKIQKRYYGNSIVLTALNRIS